MYWNRGQTKYDIESKLVNEKGEIIYVKMNSSVLYNSDNEPYGGIISFRDISEVEVIKKKLIKETQYHGIVGYHKSMIEIFELIDEIADADAAVLIQGESGTGKEMIANAIQTTSYRKNEKYIKVNCSIFPDQLLASELFGHVKGAFTGSIKDRVGRFELADKGTIFLDEVAEMPQQTQLQLLRILQEGTFERIGESTTRNVDVRVIAATNKNLEQALESGQFRQDLYYRLNVIPIHVPPLRERLDDIPYLVKHFIHKFSLLYNKNIHEIDDDSMDILLRYNWPGNVRELENTIEYAFARTKNNDVIEKTKLPAHIRISFDNIKPVTPRNIKKQDNEIAKTLEKHHWNRGKAAAELGIGRTTLWRRMKTHGLV